MQLNDRPRFSLMKKEHISYKTAKKLLDDMFKEIVAYSHSGYRESWEVLIEVLGHHLGIVDQPWLYSDPKRDYRQQIQIGPLIRPAFWVEKLPDPRAMLLAELLGIPPKKQRIIEPGPYYLPREIYYEQCYKIVDKQYPHRYSSRIDTQAERFLKKFEKEGLLKDYVAKVRKETQGSEGWGICCGVDHLGAIFEEFMLAGRQNRLGQMLTPINVVDMMIMMLQSDKPATQIEGVMEPSAGTGRMLIETSRLNPFKPLYLYGIEVDLTIYRVCLVNMALFSQHPYAIICANSLALDGTHHPEVWTECGNLWEPPNMEPYYYHFKPFKFSLASMATEAKENQSMREAMSVIAPPETPTIPQEFSLSAMAKQKQKH